MIGLDNPLHIAVLLLILLLIFGAKRLPELGRSLGAGMRGFKESISGEANAEPAAEIPTTNSERPTTSAERPTAMAGEPGDGRRAA